MKIDRVSIVIENSFDENATVRLETYPIPEMDEEVEDTPAVLLGAAVWDVVQEFLDNEEVFGNNSNSGMLQ